MSQKKQKFLIEVVGTAPIIVRYEVWAEDEDKAHEIFSRTPHLCKLRELPFIDFPRMNKLKIKVKNLLTSFVKTF